MQDIFALQDQITRKIVDALTVRLTPGEKEYIASKGTDNIEAYDAFLKGWQHYLRGTPEGLGAAINDFEKAIELDPEYGRAYAALALTFDTGNWWVEGDQLCLKWEKIMGAGLTLYSDLYRNPSGTLEGKDQYLRVTDFGMYPASYVD
jgi:tetratricopeptide (TPR) repeat protein